VDEEDAVEGGLKGRLSAGAEIYLSAKEKSAGVSTGIRFSTLPDAKPPSASGSSSIATPQPPTTITALFNPMLGHLSGAYSARVSTDLALSSRFDFNVYSYESEWTMGAEYWLRRDHDSDVDLSSKKQIHGVVKARASTNNDVAILWEGRMRNMLISLGVIADFSSRMKPIRAMGMELAYFSSDSS